MSQQNGAQSEVHRLVADTDAFIAYARLDFWETIRSELPITTTTTCYREIRGHSQLDRGERFDPEAKAKAEAAQRVVDSIEDDSCSLNQQFCGEAKKLGEWSVVELVRQYANSVEGILMMDDEDEDRAEGGRAYVRRSLDLDALEVSLPALGVPIGVLAQEGALTEDEACAGINAVSEREDWTSQSALKRIWDGVPLDCEEEPEFIR